MRLQPNKFERPPNNPVTMMVAKQDKYLHNNDHDIHATKN
jgi:hypothetical protein